MSWLNSFFVAVLTALLTATAGGFLGAGCVSWYRISSREGGSSYFVISLVLVGGFIGFVAGLIVSRFFGGRGPAGFFTGLGVSAGSTVGLAAIIALIAWSLADIPPTINGHELDLVIEARLPKGAERPPVMEGKQFVWFESGPKFAASRVSEHGLLDVASATYVDGRWVVPGSVRIFTTRDTRSLTIALNDKNAVGFQLRFPGHPGPQYAQWSDWIPDAVADHWPDSKISFRFRIQERIPPPPPPPPVDEFTLLTPDSPLEKWLSFYDAFGRDQDRYQAIMKIVVSRPADLAKLLRSSDPAEYEHAMVITGQMKAIDPQVLQAMRDVAADLEAQITRLNAMSPQQPEYEDLGAEIQTRFNRWCAPWEMVQHLSGVDGRPPVEAILKLASVHTENVHMQGVVGDAQVLLGYITHHADAGSPKQ